MADTPRYPEDLGQDFGQLLNTVNTCTCTTFEQDIDNWISIPNHKFQLDTVNYILPTEISTRLLFGLASRSYKDCASKVKLLVNKHGADVNAISSEGMYLGFSMLAIAIETRRDNVALALLDLKANANLPMGLRGQHFVIDTAFKGSPNVLESMYKHGADMNITNAWGNTALVAAVTSGRIGLVEFLLDVVKVDPNINGGTGLRVMELVDTNVPLQHDVSWNIRRDMKWSALHAAAQLKHPDSVKMIKILIKAGANVHSRCELPFASTGEATCSGYTPLELLTVHALLPGVTNERHDLKSMAASQALLEEAMKAN
ncbi:ankyrin repeat-containing domain protein [Baffinella frigidus]|nr:ankyrin repeat-containing domain protein [Cryptophyta sp. CCMP2293]